MYNIVSHDALVIFRTGLNARGSALRAIHKTSLQLFGDLIKQSGLYIIIFLCPVTKLKGYICVDLHILAKKKSHITSCNMLLTVLFFSNARIVTRGGSVELQIHEHAQEVSFIDIEWFLF